MVCGTLIPDSKALRAVEVMVLMFSPASAAASADANPIADISPDCSVLITSLESTTLSPTPSMFSPAASRMPTRLAIRLLISSNASVTLSPVDRHASLSTSSVESASLTSVFSDRPAFA